MKYKTIALVMSAALVFTPALTSCGSQQNGGSSEASQESSSQAIEVVEAPSLDGKWRQVGHAEGEKGMVGTIDGDMIALRLKSDENEFTYWVGSFEAPQSDAAYTFTSKADKGNMTGLFSSQDDTKEFKYADGKLTFTFSIRGESTEIVMEQASKETGLLAELRSGEGKSVDKNTADIKDLVLADSCYNISNGYVHYTIAVNNPNTEYAPHFIKVNVSGRTADGKISFTDDWTISNTLPESTTYWSSQAGHGNVTDSDTIEIKLSVDDDDWYKTSQKYNFYQIDNVNISTNSLGYLIATGEITLKEDVKIGRSDDARQPSLQCVLKDANGKLVGGFNTYMNGELKVGEATPFEIQDHYLSKDFAYATAEVYANPWM